MGFSVFVEFLNIQLRKRGEPVKLHKVPTTQDMPQTGSDGA